MQEKSRPDPYGQSGKAAQRDSKRRDWILFDHHDQLPPLLSGCCEKYPRTVDWSRQQRRNESSQFHQQRLGEDKNDGNDENGFVDDQ